MNGGKLGPQKQYFRNFRTEMCTASGTYLVQNLGKNTFKQIIWDVHKYRCTYPFNSKYERSTDIPASPDSVLGGSMRILSSDFAVRQGFVVGG